MIKLAKQLFVNPSKVLLCNINDSFVVLYIEGHNIYFNYRVGITQYMKELGFDAIMKALNGKDNFEKTMVQCFKSCEKGNQKYLYLLDTND